MQNPFVYTGEYTDAESGLIYLRARYYDPATQQFLTVDPMLVDTEQAYAYAAGSPTNFTDPSGMFVDEILDAYFIASHTVDIACNGLNVENGLALAADVAFAFLPFATGGGLLVHAVMHAADEGLHAGRAAHIAEGKRATKVAKDETLWRYGSGNGTGPESVNKLRADAAKAQEKAGIHGVSSFNHPLRGPASTASRAELEESGFEVQNTFGRGHRTIIMPEPITQEVADVFNRLFGR